MSAHLDTLTLQGLGSGDRPPLDGEARSHLAACAECQASVEGWRRLSASLDALPLPPADPAFAGEVLARVDALPAAPALRAWIFGVGALTLLTVGLAALGADRLEALPALLARGLGALGTTLAALLATAGAVAEALPEGSSAAVLVAELFFFVLVTRLFARLQPSGARGAGTELAAARSSSRKGDRP